VGTYFQMFVDLTGVSTVYGMRMNYVQGFAIILIAEQIGVSGETAAEEIIVCAGFNKRVGMVLLK
jgi:hypothetical protein